MHVLNHCAYFVHVNIVDIVQNVLEKDSWLNVSSPTSAHLASSDTQIINGHIQVSFDVTHNFFEYLMVQVRIYYDFKKRLYCPKEIKSVGSYHIYIDL